MAFQIYETIDFEAQMVWQKTESYIMVHCMNACVAQVRP